MFRGCPAGGGPNGIQSNLIPSAIIESPKESSVYHLSPPMSTGVKEKEDIISELKVLKTYD